MTARAKGPEGPCLSPRGGFTHPPPPPEKERGRPPAAGSVARFQRRPAGTSRWHRTRRRQPAPCGCGARVNYIAIMTQRSLITGRSPAPGENAPLPADTAPVPPPASPGAAKSRRNGGSGPAAARPPPGALAGGTGSRSPAPAAGKPLPSPTRALFSRKSKSLRNAGGINSSPPRTRAARALWPVC